MATGVSLISIFVRFELLEKLLLTELVVDPEIGKEILNEHVGPAKRLAEINQPRDGNGKAQIAQQDVRDVPILKQRATRVEVVDASALAVLLALAAALSLLLVVVVARYATSAASCRSAL
jgi:hypothetical protein